MTHSLHVWVFEFALTLIFLFQNLASLSVVTDLWKLEKSVTAATAISVKTRAAIVPMKQRAKGANANLAKSAGKMILKEMSL